MSSGQRALDPRLPSISRETITAAYRRTPDFPRLTLFDLGLILCVGNAGKLCNLACSAFHQLQVAHQALSGHFLNDSMQPSFADDLLSNK